MSVECWVIIVLILAMAVIIMRRGTPRQGVSILPLALVPFGYLIAGPISRWLDGFFPSISSDLFRVSFTLIALVFACVLFGMLAGNMGGKATRRVYMFLCGGFSVILSFDSSILISRQAGNGFYEIRYDKKQNNDDRRFIVGIGNLGIRRSFHASMY